MCIGVADPETTFTQANDESAHSHMDSLMQSFMRKRRKLQEKGLAEGRRSTVYSVVMNAATLD